MIVVTTIAALRETLDKARQQGLRVGFVPTMGALHAGHASLVHVARESSGLVVVSIFVNPTQFNDSGDLKNYPRTFDADHALLVAAGCTVLFFPEVGEMYPEGTATHSPVVDLGGLDLPMEGSTRPGHFAGVVRIVHKLFEAVGPCSAFFGQKDFQQLAIVRRMTKQLGLPVEIVGCSIVREADGLAMSSRNVRLTV
ncbi:MAG: pantoate--beta-alanine ligase, partial [Bacteroidia bacterium]